MYWLTSESTAALDAALAKAQGAMLAAPKDKENPHFRSKYADLAGVWDACRAALSGAGIAVTQWPITSDDGRLHLVTRLAHAGEWMVAEMSLPVGKQDAHGYGSAITYCRRFALAAAVGVVSDDDDGNGAVGTAKADDAPKPNKYGPAPRKDMPAKAPASQITAVSPPAPTEGVTPVPPDATPDAVKAMFPGAEIVSGGVITPAQVARLQAIARTAGHKGGDVKTWLSTVYGVDSSKAISVSDYSDISARLADKTPLC